MSNDKVIKIEWKCTFCYFFGESGWSGYTIFRGRFYKLWGRRSRRKKNEECRKKEESSLFELGCVNAVAAANLQTSLGEEERKDRVKDTLRTKKKEEISFFEKYKNLQL